MTREGTIMVWQRRRLASVVLLVAGLTTGLAACAPTAPSTSDGGGSVDGDSSATQGDDSGFSGVVLPGTGRYAIGSEAPLGSYQLKGEPAGQPSGCTWSIEDADGGVTFADQGSYVFITDIKEAVTFVTNGCPDWEQFE